MYARITTFKVKAANLSEMPAKIEEMKPATRALPGIVDIYSCWRADGQGVVTAVYKDKASAESATEQIKAIWGSLSSMLTAAPMTETYDHVEHMAG